GSDATRLSAIAALAHQPLIAIADDQARCCGTEHPAEQPLHPPARGGRLHHREYDVAEIGELLGVVFILLLGHILANQGRCAITLHRSPSPTRKRCRGSSRAARRAAGARARRWLSVIFLRPAALVPCSTP